MGIFSVARVRRVAANALVLVTSVFLSLVAAEFAVRLFAPQQLILIRPDIWRPADTLGWAHQPNIDARVNTGERAVRMITDENGFRVGVGGRPEGEIRILLLGDSFMAAMQVEHEQSLAGLIERHAAEALGASAAVWNTGVGAWDPPQYLLQARRALDEWQFDLVLVSVFMGNDVVFEGRSHFSPRRPVDRATLRFPRELTVVEFINSWLAPVNDGLESRSHLFVLMKTQFQSVLMRLGLTAVHVPSELQRDQTDSERWEVTGDILAEIDSLALTYDVPSLFVLIPAVQQVDEGLLRRHLRAFDIDPMSLDVDQPDRLLLEALQGHGLRVVSATRALREALTEGVEPYGRIDTHLSPDGHRVIWDVLEGPLTQVLMGPCPTESERDAECRRP